MTVPGPNTAAAPASNSASRSSGGMTPPATIMMSSRPRSASSSRSWGIKRQVAGGQRADADNVHVVFDGLPRGFGRRAEQRADVDVKSEIGKGAGNHFLAAVVAVLAHLGDQDPRSTTFGFLEPFDQLPYFVGHAVTLQCRCVDAADRLYRCFVAAEDLLQRLADFAHGRLCPGRIDGQFEQVSRVVLRRSA